MKKICILSSLIIYAALCYKNAWAHNPAKSAMGRLHVNNSKEVQVCLAFSKAYNINFSEQELNIELWCTLKHG